MMLDCDPRLSYRPVCPWAPAWYACKGWRATIERTPKKGVGNLWLVKLLRCEGSYVYGREVDHRWAGSERDACRKAQAVLVNLLDRQEAEARRWANEHLAAKAAQLMSLEA